jgi:hypothetical protein
MNFNQIAIPVLAGLCLGMLVMLECGRRIGLWHRRHAGEHAGAGLGTVEGSVFGLVGLLLAFTFSGAASRFDARRALIVEETNDIGTAYLRLDLLPPDAQPALRQAFREYVEARLAIYQALPDTAGARRAQVRSLDLQADIWSQAVAATQATPATQPMMLLLPALNAMFDIATTRTMALRTHPPLVIYLLLGVLALVGALLAGYGMSAAAARNWLHILGFALIMTGTMYVIMDFEFPRLGLIRVEAFDQALVDVLNGMK